MKGNEGHFRKLERMYATGPCNAYWKPQLTVDRGRALVRIALRDDLLHSGGTAHGSVYFKALDDAAFFAVNSLVTDVLVLTASFHVQLVRPVRQGVVTAEGRIVAAGSTLFVAEAEMVDQRNRLLAKGSGTFVRGKVPLEPSIGYR